jgi:hypothetical protein
VCDSFVLQIVFFGRHQMKESTKVMAAFWASIAASIAAFYQVSQTQAVLAAATAGCHRGHVPLCCLV